MQGFVRLCVGPKLQPVRASILSHTLHIPLDDPRLHLQPWRGERFVQPKPHRY
jgi:hypothetical protein